MDRSESGLLVLHALRLAGFVDAPAVSERLALPLDEVEHHLSNAAQDGFARHRSGTRSGWSLTDEGRKENERLLAEELDRRGLRDGVTAAYRRFLPLNRAILLVCTDWQVVDLGTGTLNDHTNPGYDRAVIDRLGRIDDDVQPICAEMAARLERFSGYGPRFRQARQRIEAGEADWFTRPTIDSYHTVWFELHEDLLATLGLDRTVEAGEGSGPEPTPGRD